MKFLSPESMTLLNVPVARIQSVLSGIQWSYWEQLFLAEGAPPGAETSCPAPEQMEDNGKHSL